MSIICHQHKYQISTITIQQHELPYVWFGKIMKSTTCTTIPVHALLQNYHQFFGDAAPSVGHRSLHQHQRRSRHDIISLVYSHKKTSKSHRPMLCLGIPNFARRFLRLVGEFSRKTFLLAARRVRKDFDRRVGGGSPRSLSIQRGCGREFGVGVETVSERSIALTEQRIQYPTGCSSLPPISLRGLGRRNEIPWICFSVDCYSKGEID